MTVYTCIEYLFKDTQKLMRGREEERVGRNEEERKREGERERER